jgi:sugar lactone lactonase YvrE
MHPALPCLALAAGLALLSTRAEVQIITHPSDPLREPFAVDFAPDGAVYGVEFTKGNRVFRYQRGQIDFPAGFRHASDSKQPDAEVGDGGPAERASFNGLHDIAITRDGRAFLADTWNHRIRVFDLRTGKVSTFAGTGTPGFSGDGGPAAAAQFNQPYCCSLTADHSALYVADLANHRVRRIDLATGVVRTVAGSGKRGAADASVPATESPLQGPRAVVARSDDVVYIALREGNALLELREGRLRPVVNASGKPGLAGDGGPAHEAQLKGPKYLAFDAEGAVLIVDTENHAIRRYDPRDGRLTTVAGRLGQPGGTTGTTLLDTPLKRPHGVKLDAQGRWWIADSDNHRLVVGKP